MVELKLHDDELDVLVIVVMYVEVVVGGDPYTETIVEVMTVRAAAGASGFSADPDAGAAEFGTLSAPVVEFDAVSEAAVDVDEGDGAVVGSSSQLGQFLSAAYRRLNRHVGVPMGAKVVWVVVCVRNIVVGYSAIPWIPKVITRSTAKAPSVTTTGSFVQVFINCHVNPGVPVPGLSVTMIDCTVVAPSIVYVRVMNGEGPSRATISVGFGGQSCKFVVDVGSMTFGTMNDFAVFSVRTERVRNASS